MFGNPLLDITVQIKDDELLKKYSLEKNGQKEVSLELLSKLIGDAKARYVNKKFFVPLYRFNNATTIHQLLMHGEIRRKLMVHMSHLHGSLSLGNFKLNIFFFIFRYQHMKFRLGGSGLNTSRILAAMGQHQLLFFGAIGHDQNGKIVREILKRSMVAAR